MERINFLQAMYQANLLYGVSFNDTSDFEEIALNAWNIIGNKETILYRYVTGVDPQTLTVELPCNCDEIEAVLAPGEDFGGSDLVNGPNFKNLFGEEYSEWFKPNSHGLYERGHYVHFHRVGDKLYFKEPYPIILILYKGVVLDDDDLPYLTEKEMNAIATYVAYIMKFKEAMQTNNQAALQFSQMLEKKWYVQCDSARTPTRLSQNDFNEIATAKSRWPGQKRFNISYKPLV